MSNLKPTLLSQIGSLVTVNIDSMDPEAALRHDPMTFTDMTSNQALVYAQMTKPENAELVREAAEYVRQRHPLSDQNPREYLLEALDVVTVRLAKLVYPFLKGKVHAQTSPNFAYDTQKTVAHAKRLIALFDEHGIPSSRVCIKIPATPESILACHILSSRKPDSSEPLIHTLATCVFSVPQARAALQAGCIYVAPYFNDLRVHFEPSTWKEYEDTVAQHPMSSVIAEIIAALKGSQTLVMPASIVTVSEVLALVSLRPDCITISAPLLDQLRELPQESIMPEKIANVPAPKAPIKEVDYLSMEGVHLKEAFMREPDISRRVVEALGLFGASEQRAMEYIRSGTVDVEWDGRSGW